MREFCVLVFLGLNSWMDIKKREIYIWYTRGLNGVQSAF